MWFCTVVVLSGLDTMLDNDLIGDFVSSPSVFNLCFSGPIEWSESELIKRLTPLEKDIEDDDDSMLFPQLIIDRPTVCFNEALFTTFCFNEFCCDGDKVLSWSCSRQTQKKRKKINHFLFLTKFNIHTWIIIKWSPSLTLRFKGDLPLKKSFTWLSFNDSSACITVFSALPRIVKKEFIFTFFLIFFVWLIAVVAKTHYVLLVIGRMDEDIESCQIIMNLITAKS